MNREEWLKARMTGIGGSEMAAILGVSPWSSPADVWARKKGLIPELEDNLRFKIGRLFEAPIAQIYADREGVSLQLVNGIYRHPEAPLVGTPDRLIVGQKKGLEIKTADPAVAHTWGEPETDEIPAYYLSQVAVYMALLDYDKWDVAVLFGTSDFRIYRITRDLELEEMILQRARDFWHRYIEGDEEPPPDESKAYTNYVAKKYPSNQLPMVQATEEQAALVEALFNVDAGAKDVAKKLDLLKNMVKAQIGESEGLETPYGKVTWKKAKDSEKVEWESLAEKLMAKKKPAQCAELVKEFTKTVPGVRKLYLSPSKLPVKGGTE